MSELMRQQIEYSWNKCDAGVRAGIWNGTWDVATCIADIAAADPRSAVESARCAMLSYASAGLYALARARYALALRVGVFLFVAIAFAATAQAEPPIPPSQWTDEARLTLARSCAAEAELDLDECTTIANLYARRWHRTHERQGWSFAAFVWTYSKPLSRPNPPDRAARIRRFPLGLTTDERPRWARIVAALDRWAKTGEGVDLCPRADHFGGRDDPPLPGCHVLECPTLNRFAEC